MDAAKNPARAAAALHAKIVAKLAAIRSTKIDVYFLLREFRDAKLYRHLDLPISPAHAGRLGHAPAAAEICAGNSEHTENTPQMDADGRRWEEEKNSPRMDTDEHGSEEAGGEQGAKICAGRRFTTWEDYLASLGDAGISFAYFAELDRLAQRFGDDFVRLCARGVPVRVRRLLLTAPARIAHEVRVAAASALSLKDKLDTVDTFAGIWRSEREFRGRSPASSIRRVADYARHTADWTAKFSNMVGVLERASGTYRGCAFATNLVSAWRRGFEQQLELGERLAALALDDRLTARHGEILRLVRDAWTPCRLDALSALPAMPPVHERAVPAAVYRPRAPRPVADSMPRVGLPRRCGYP